MLLPKDMMFSHLTSVGPFDNSKPCDVISGQSILVKIGFFWHKPKNGGVGDGWWGLSRPPK